MKKTLLILVLSMTHLTAVPLLPPHDPRLREIAKPVDDILSTETQRDIQNLLTYAYELNEEQGLAGLAGPQVGIFKRIIAVDTFLDKKREIRGPLTIYINPEILWYSPEIEEDREGCFSVNNELVGIVPRSEKIYIRAFDKEGQLIEKELTGFTARIFQHEVDHLNGLCFPERVGPEGKLHFVEEDQYPAYRENWQNWPHKVTWQEWRALQNGKKS